MENNKSVMIKGYKPSDKLNDPDGIDYSFQLVMVTPEKMVLKIEEDEDNYVFTEFRKAKGTLKQIGK